MKTRAMILAVAMIAASACGDGCAEEPAPSPSPPDEGDFEETTDEARGPDGTEVVGDVLIISMKPVDLLALPASTRDRLDALRPVAAAAEDLHWALGGSGRLRVRDMLRGITARPGDAPPGIVSRIRDYAAPVLLWHALEDPRDGRRFKPRFIPGELAAAAEAASMAGADLPLGDSSDPAATRIDQIEALLKQVLPLLFDTPGLPLDGGVEEMTLAREVEALRERIERLLVLIHGQALGGGREERPAQLVNDGGGEGLAAIVGFRDLGSRPGFGALLAVPDPGAAESLEHLLALGPKLSGVVERTGGDRVPVGRATERKLEPVVVAEATGSFGPLPEPGLFPLLDGPLFDEPATGRLLLAVNLARALDAAPEVETLVRITSPDDETARRRLAHRSCSRLARHALVAAAGRGTDGTESRAPGFLVNRLGSAAPVMGHLREQLVSLHLAMEPAVVEALPGGEECSRALLDDFAASAVEHLLDTEAGRESPAAVARRIAIGRLAETGALAVSAEGGGVPHVVDREQLRQAVAALLGEVRRIRHTGDGEAARAMIARYGPAPASWSAVAARVTAAIGGITTVAFAMSYD